MKIIIEESEANRIRCDAIIKINKWLIIISLYLIYCFFRLIIDSIKNKNVESITQAIECLLLLVLVLLFIMRKIRWINSYFLVNYNNRITEIELKRNDNEIIINNITNNRVEKLYTYSYDKVFKTTKTLIITTKDYNIYMFNRTTKIEDILLNNRKVNYNE